MENKICTHIESITELKLSNDHVCEQCIKTNSAWVHLRTCQTCGTTLCCDQSSNQHMTNHYHQTGHPVVISAERGEKWMYCYADEIFTEYE